MRPPLPIDDVGVPLAVQNPQGSWQKMINASRLTWEQSNIDNVILVPLFFDVWKLPGPQKQFRRKLPLHVLVSMALLGVYPKSFLGDESESMAQKRGSRNFISYLKHKKLLDPLFGDIPNQ